MKINEIRDMKNEITELEKIIDKNTKNFMQQITSCIKTLARENEDILKIKSINDNMIRVDVYDYKFIFTYMESYIVPKLQFPELERREELLNQRKILSDKNIRKYYSSCISVYYVDPLLDCNTGLNTNMFFINEDYDIAVRGKNKHTYFEKKEKVFDNLENILASTFSRIFDIEKYIPTDIDIIDINSLGNRKFKIGFIND